jgi:hypothetical protein
MKTVVDGQPLREAEAPKTKSYKLRSGFTHINEKGERLEPGADVELTEQAYRSFADKFEPSDKKRSAKDDGTQSREDMEKALREPAPLPTSHLPQDLGAKTPNLEVGDLNPGNVTQTRRAAGNPPVSNLPADGVSSEEAPKVGGKQAESQETKTEQKPLSAPAKPK